jgi:branched-subunit amino acid aminotransferase/4-amino-4-deoxychorismate lyase
MHKFISFNGEICTPAYANVPALSSAALYGWGIFTSLRIYDSRPFLWEKHWRHLTDYAAAVGIDISEITERYVYENLSAVIAANKIKSARARITFFDNSAGFWNCAASDKTNVLIATADFRELPDSFNLTVSPFRVNTASPLAGIKSCNYLENLLAWEKAKTSGFDEAVRLNERDEVVSACIANIFWVKEKKLYTPSLKTGTLAGTMRSFILEQAKLNFIEYFEVEQDLDSLLSADECFLTSSGIGIKGVNKIADTAYANDEMTEIIADLLQF